MCLLHGKEALYARSRFTNELDAFGSSKALKSWFPEGLEQFVGEQDG